MTFDLSRLTQKQLTVVTATVLCVSLFAFVLFLPADVGNGDEVKISIERGQGVREIAGLLKEQGLITSTRLFVLYAVLTGAQRDLQAGTYLLSPSLPMPVIVSRMARGQAESTDIEVLMPEGSNVWEIDAILVKAGLAAPGAFSSAWSFKEGHLFPDTYRFAEDAILEEIARKMEQNYFDKGGTRGDIDLIIASMLEKEAKTEDDMALIAGIIAKRLERGMALQIDATVAYGWCVRTTNFRRPCDVTRAPIASEIAVDGPYNTYARTGLPRSAVSNPGLKALKAAAHPKDSPYLYYLSTRDGSRIIYSKTAEEHARNRKRYLGL